MTDNDVRDLLAHVAELAPTQLADRHSRRWRQPLVLAAVAAVAAVCVPLVVLHPLGRPASRQLSGAGRTASPAPLAADARRVVFRGLAVDVPKQWLDDKAVCGSPIVDTVMHADGGFRDCLSRQQPVVSYVELRKATSNGQPCAPQGMPVARCESTDNVGRTVVLLRIPDRDADALVVSPDATLANQIATTAQVVEQDAGCPVDPSQLGPIGPARSGGLIPGTPESATVCRWSDGLLARTGELRGESLDTFVRAVRALPAGLGQARVQDGNPAPGDPRCAQEARRAIRITVHYQGDADKNLWLRLTGCGRVIGFDDGTHTALPRMPAISPLLSIVGFDTGFPSVQ